jgi:hypothetical protein
MSFYEFWYEHYVSGDWATELMKMTDSLLGHSERRADTDLIFMFNCPTNISDQSS